MGISLGLVGLGGFGSAFADLFKRHPSVDRIGLCDREPDRVEAFAKLDSFKDKFDPADSYASLDEICNAQFDAILLPVVRALSLALGSGFHPSIADVLANSVIP